MSYLLHQNKLKIRSINISNKRGHTKTPVDSAFIERIGIANDAHADEWNRQISMLSYEGVKRYEEKIDQKLTFGQFGENLVVEGIDFSQINLLDRLQIGSDAILEVTYNNIDKHDEECPFCKGKGECLMKNEGIFLRVVTPGEIKLEDEITYQQKLLRFHVITISDRVSKGEYDDRSGMRIVKKINSHFSGKNYKTAINQTIIADNVEQIESVIDNCLQQNIDVIITTGGTGIGPRDITPDVIRPLIDRELPGIMDSIRVKISHKHPKAILSRNFAGTIDKSLIYLLPGSFTIVNDYMDEILQILEDAIFMFRGLNVHQ